MFPVKDISKVHVYYRTFDGTGTEIIHLTKKPTAVLLNETPLHEAANASEEGFIENPLQKDGVLTVNRINGNQITNIE